jgi:hypothetical protein
MNIEKMIDRSCVITTDYGDHDGNDDQQEQQKKNMIMQITQNNTYIILYIQ